MKTLLKILASLAALLLVVVCIGYALPLKHRATRMAAYIATPDSIFAIITNSSAFPKWRTGVSAVENIASPDSAWRYREKGTDGDVLYVVDEAVPAQRLVTRIADKSLPYGGKWTYEITPSLTGAWLRITEDGEVYNPLFRFMSRFVFGQHATIDTYLNDLGRRMNQSVTIMD